MTLLSKWQVLEWLKVTQLCGTICDSLGASRQVPLSMEFSSLEYWSRLTFPSLGEIPDPGIEPGSLALQADSFPPGIGCYFLLQDIFWTQGSHPIPCIVRQILHHWAWENQNYSMAISFFSLFFFFLALMSPWCGFFFLHFFLFFLILFYF